MPRRALVVASEDLARRDAKLAAIIAIVGPCDIRRSRPKRTHFAELVRAICYQQLAGAAASTIHGRVEALFDGPPTPEAMLALPIESLRGAGLSGNKTASVRDLAERVLAGDVELDRMSRLPDDEVVRELTLVRGIGRWTAEMFLIFHLMRPNVLPLDDIGLIKGISVNYFSGEPVSRAEAREVGDAWAPFRSVATWYIWRSIDPLPVSY
jgi:DNA-3-methyladenine glycosylase II